MPSADYFFDVIETLGADPDGYFFLMYAQPGETEARWAAFAPSEEHIQFFIERFPDCVKQFRGASTDNTDN